MPSIRQSIRSSTASKRPTSAIADGQIALNTASGTPGMFFKDSAGNIVKAGPAHYGATAPNSSPAVGGSTGNSFGETWLDSSLTPAGWKIWNGSAWVNATPLSSDTVQGLVELATNAETQTGVDTARAVTAAGLQSKVSDSISTTSASGIASSTAVKTAYDLANAALPKTGGIITGNLEIGSTGSFTFEGSTADAFETTLDVVDPTADRTITFPNITGTVVTTGDTGTVTSTMILDGTILNADINASAAIAFSKLATLSSANILVGNASGVPTSVAMSGDITIGNTGVAAIASNVIVHADINASAAIVDTKLDTIATALKVSNSATTATSANTASAIVARDASGNFTAGTITAALTGAASSNVLKAGDTMTGVLAVTAGTAALPGIAVSGDLNTGLVSPGADQLAITTGGTSRLAVSTTAVSSTLAVDVPLGAVGTPSLTFTGDLNTGLFSPGADTVALVTGGTNRLHITSAGLVGLGTSSVNAGAALHIAKNTNGNIAVLRISGNDGSGDGGAGIVFADNETVKWSLFTRRYSSNNRLYFSTVENDTSAAKVTITEGGSVGIGSTSPNRTLHVFGDTALSNSANTGTFLFAPSASANFLYSRAADSVTTALPFALAVGSTEALRVDTSGRLLVGTSTLLSGVVSSLIQASQSASDYVIACKSTHSTPYGYYIGYSTSPNNTGSEFLVCTDATTTRASIRSNGGLANFSANNANLSDRNAKKDISPAADTWNCLKKWEIVNYRYKDQPADADLNLGVIAQQVAESCPEVITVFEEAKDDQPEKLGVKEQQMYWMAIKALQEAQVRIETLEAEVAALKGA